MAHLGRASHMAARARWAKADFAISPYARCLSA